MIATKKAGFAGIVATGFVAAILGLAAPAQAVTAVEAPAAASSFVTVPAGIDHHGWLYDVGPHVNVPQVDNSVHQSR